MFFRMRSLMWIAIVGVLLTGFYWLAKPTSSTPSRALLAVDKPQTAGSAPMALKTFTVRVAAPGAKQEQPVFRVTENDDVAIQVVSEQAGTLMLHGYTNGVVTVAKNGEATVRFKAVHTGRFLLHLHGEGGSHVELASIEILPH